MINVGTVALNHKEMGKNSGRILKIEPVTDERNWKDINSSSGKKHWKTFQKNNPTIALDMLYTKK